MVSSPPVHTRTRPSATADAGTVSGGELDGAEGGSLRRSDLLLVFSFWTFVAALTAVNGLIDPPGRGPHPVFPSSPLTLALIEAFLWAVITLLAFWLVSRFGIERTGRAARVALFLSAGLVLAILVDQIVSYIRYEVLFVARRASFNPEPLTRLRRLWFMNELVIYIAILAAAYARAFFLRYRARREEAVRLQAHTAHLQAQLADARLAALQAQVNPHFLFNTLHAISALVERDPKGVRRMIARLSELLRTTLEGASAAEVTLAQELAFLRRYLEIMQIRFQGRLEVEIRVAPELQSALVPNLILQPLVENALKHGAGKLEGVGRIAIEAQRNGAQLQLSVTDNGPGLRGEETATGSGLGLRNTRARLEELYAGAQSLTLLPLPQGGLCAQILLPYHTSDDLRTAGVGAAH